MKLTDCETWNLTPAQFEALAQRYDDTLTLANFRAGLVANRIEASAGVGSPTQPLDYFKSEAKEKEERSVDDYVASRVGKAAIYNAIESARRAKAK